MAKALHYRRINPEMKSDQKRILNKGLLDFSDVFNEKKSVTRYGNWQVQP
jgi:hypothetical protein